MIGLPRLHQLATTTDPKGPTMTTISDKDRAEAQAIAEVLHGRGVISALSDSGVRRWLAVRDHVLAAHECPTVPVWRPTTRDEIQAGWEVRSRRRNGSESVWGVAHHRDDDRDWRTEAGSQLTYAAVGWTCETTAPLPEPEPWDEALVRAAVAVMADAEAESDDREDEARAVLDLLADRGLIDRAAIVGGGQS